MNKVLFFNFMKKKIRGKFEKIINQFLTNLIKEKSVKTHKLQSKTHEKKFKTHLGIKHTTD